MTAALHRNSSALPDGLRIEDMIQSQCIHTRYQPIISLKKQCTIGFEAYCYGLNPVTGKEIPLRTLYRAAEQEELFVEFDRYCRKISLGALAVLHKVNPALQLFLRFEGAVLNYGVVGSNILFEQVSALGVPPHNVVIEVIESSVREDRTLAQFVKAYQERNFLIGLCGLGHSHLYLQRIPLVCPNTVHIEGDLITGLAQSKMNQIVVRSLVQLANNMGALVVANGIESIEAGVIATELGIDMQQGSLFGKPHALDRHNLMACQARIREIVKISKGEIAARIAVMRKQRKHLEETAHSIAKILTGLSTREFSAVLGDAAKRHREIECLYILNDRGIQIGDTVCGHALSAAISGSMFQPAADRTDQSLKDYYYRRQDMDGDLYISEPYVSLASGSTCITLSLSFSSTANSEYILCVDFIV